MDSFEMSNADYNQLLLSTEHLENMSQIIENSYRPNYPASFAGTHLLYIESYLWTTESKEVKQLYKDYSEQIKKLYKEQMFGVIKINKRQ
ncbi:9047_t:CDS:2 [Funneliformis caledonium]|uniref:9047_t:CDS:1 n=1 Tax=Funneliformis caledonium TaxID=1117310 RepID=A0A9N9D7A7_9GLOM|nr:9047_t:CDS:2 [Funneliformis caledonium]